MPPTRKIRAKPSDGLYEGEFAARVGVERRTLSGWRATGRPQWNPVPEPDGWAPDGGKLRPWWRETTADAWDARREGSPGRSKPVASEDS